ESGVAERFSVRLRSRSFLLLSLPLAPVQCPRSSQRHITPQFSSRAALRSAGTLSPREAPTRGSLRAVPETAILGPRLAIVDDIGTCGRRRTNPTCSSGSSRGATRIGGAHIEPLLRLPGADARRQCGPDAKHLAA